MPATDGTFRHTGSVRPLRLLLDGFGTYRNETEIDFADVDFFVLVGPTGSGKSTVIDALCFALYGTVPRWDNEKEVRNALAPSTNACRVSLIFELAGERYVAARSLQRGKQGHVTTKAARLERLDASIPPQAPLQEILEASVEQLAEGPDNVKSRVQELLGLSYEHFTQSVLLPQGGFADFLRATPANRQRLLVELLAFGVYKEIGQRARERADTARNRCDLAQQARDQLADATEEAEAEAASRFRDLGKLTDAVDKSLSDLAELHKQAELAREKATTTGNEAALLAALRTPAEVPGLSDQISAAQELVARSRQRREEAEQLAETARHARAELPDKAATQQQLGMYALRRELEARAETQQAALDSCRAAEQLSAAELTAADETLIQAQDKLAAARRAHAAADLAVTLHAGDDCPVCRQRIVALPAPEAPADLNAAEAAVGPATAARRKAQKAHEDAGKAAAAASSSLAETRDRLDKAAQVMADVPAEAELTSQLEAIAVADSAVTRTRDEATARQTELAAADQARRALDADEKRAWAKLNAERDKLVGLGAPAIGADTAVPASQQVAADGAGASDLAAAWAALVSWADTEYDKRKAQQPELDETAARLRQQFEDALAALVSLLAENGITDASDPARIPRTVATHYARAEATLQQVRADRKKAAQLDKQIAAYREDSQVAGMLGNLLRATSFERWLCSEALDSLVREASATLMELSGGQYELDRDERNELVVIDYEDAGARRPVHTLSGGETFQASLALALALSRQVIGLSAGMRELNSMFLDEGFGTLDPDTLDTVASTLERLAADSDRMVGVITHVAELAERVPVKFVVNRTGTTSTIVKERA
ncbi:MAG TPA: SMC family ATPase [Streptosporangiaceae bacterium]|nr:SMC family ATPase [Streptosporangiaceae bacterium]